MKQVLVKGIKLGIKENAYSALDVLSGGDASNYVECLVDSIPDCKKEDITEQIDRCNYFEENIMDLLSKFSGPEQQTVMKVLLSLDVILHGD